MVPPVIINLLFINSESGCKDDIRSGLKSFKGSFWEHSSKNEVYPIESKLWCGLLKICLSKGLIDS